MAKTKKENEISTSVNEVPAFMQDDRKMGTELLGKYIRPPILKVIQPLTKPPLIDLFDPGDLIIMPTNTLISSLEKDEEGKRMKKGSKVPFVPIYFWPEWIVQNPLEIKEQHGSIRDRTFDPESTIAAKARNPKTRHEPCPEKPDRNISYLEVFNYAVIIMREDVPAEPAILRFKAGEHSAGTAFNSLLQARNAPPFGCVFDMQVGFRSNSKGQWFGIDCMNPESGPWVESKELYDAFKEKHEDFKSFHEANAIVVEDDTEADAAPATSEF